MKQDGINEVEELKIGEYTITKMNADPGSGWWISKDDGEGMEVSNVTLVALLEKFWNENF